MVKIDKHIRNTVLLAMLVVVMLISSVDVVFALADEIGDTDEHYSMMNALAFIAFTLPTRIYELLPFIALGGALVGLGILASNNELVIMQAAGVSVWRIVWSVLKPTSLIMLCSLLLGEYIAPPLEQLAQSNKAVQQSANESISSEQGTWRKVGDEYIHINAIAPGGELLYGVTRYEIGSNRNIVASSFCGVCPLCGWGRLKLLAVEQRATEQLHSGGDHSARVFAGGLAGRSLSRATLGITYRARPPIDNGAV